MTLSPVFALDEVAPTNGNEITQKQIANISENDLINYVYLEETETTNSYENVVLYLKNEYKNGRALHGPEHRVMGNARPENI